MIKEKLRHYLEMFLYCEKLRALINELKAKDDFRPEGLRTIDIIKIKLWLLFMSFFLFALWIGRSDGIVLTFILMLLPFLDRGGDIPLVSIGKLGHGKLIGVYDMFYTIRLYYSRVDPDGRERIIELKGYIRQMATKDDDKEAQLYPEKRILTVLHHPQNAYFCTPFVPSVHLNKCISKSQYERLKDLPFIRENP